LTNTTDLLIHVHLVDGRINYGQVITNPHLTLKRFQLTKRAIKLIMDCSWRR